jgi:hypothetical protein
VRGGEESSSLEFLFLFFQEKRKEGTLTGRFYGA